MPGDSRKAICCDRNAGAYGSHDYQYNGRLRAGGGERAEAMLIRDREVFEDMVVIRMCRNILQNNTRTAFFALHFSNARINSNSPISGVQMLEYQKTCEIFRSDIGTI